MRNFPAPAAPLFNGPPEPNPMSPIDKLRCEIGKAADCLTRMLDTAQEDELRYTHWVYLADQFEHLTRVLLHLEGCIDGIGNAIHAPEVDNDLPAPDEILELTQPARDAAAGEGGAA